MKRPERTANAEAVFLDTAWPDMMETLAKNDASAAQKQFENVRNACMACHMRKVCPSSTTSLCSANCVLTTDPPHGNRLQAQHASSREGNHELPGKSAVETPLTLPRSESPMKILVIEDNPDILANVLDYLQLKGFIADCARDGLSGLHLAVSGHYDLIVLDLMLPGIDGYQLCQRLREDARLATPIIMLTARDTLDDRLQGLKTGADDYLIKPFALPELVARIEAILRRTRGGLVHQLQVDDLVYDLDTLRVSRNGKPLKLNPIALKLLAVLMQKSPAVVRRETLEQAIWGEDPPDSDSLRSHIYQLRQALDKPFDRPLLHTVHGVGYCVAKSPKDY